LEKKGNRYSEEAKIIFEARQKIFKIRRKAEQKRRNELRDRALNKRKQELRAQIRHINNIQKRFSNSSGKNWQKKNWQKKQERVPLSLVGMVNR